MILGFLEDNRWDAYTSAFHTPLNSESSQQTGFTTFSSSKPRSFWSAPRRSCVHKDVMYGELYIGRDPFNQNSDRSDREKRTTSKGGPVFSKLFRLDRTDPLRFGPKFPELLVEWMAPYNVPDGVGDHPVRTPT